MVDQVNSTEIMDAIDLVVSSKGISRDELLDIVQASIMESMHEKYGDGGNIKVNINKQSGEITLFRDMIVAEDESQDPNLYISFSQARRIDPNCSVGDTIQQLLPDITSDRKSANFIKNVIFGKIKSVEKQIEYDQFKNREGETVTGFVKRATKFGCIVSIGSKTEGAIFREGMIFGETFTEKEKVSAVISEVRRSDNDFQIILSRTSNHFLLSLLREAVPEIESGLVEVKSVARNPGSRAKVAVWSSDVRVDAVGSCIGARGSRISQVVAELKGEKVDIISWDRDILTFARNAIVPAKPVKVELAKDDNDNDILDIVVRDEDLRLAIGKRGQNVRLASELIGMNLNITSEESRREKLMNRLQRIMSGLTKALDIDEIVAQLLISEGFITVSKIASSAVDDLARIQGFNEKVASELHARAVEWHDKLQKEYQDEVAKVGFDQKVSELPFVGPQECMILMEKGVKTLQDIADLASDELAELLEESILERSQISKISAAAKSAVYGD